MLPAIIKDKLLYVVVLEINQSTSHLYYYNSYNRNILVSNLKDATKFSKDRAENIVEQINSQSGKLYLDFDGKFIDKSDIIDIGIYEFHNGYPHRLERIE